jgi:glycerol uptake facilitator-like aquaporin
MKAYITEFIGTFFLVFTIAMTGDPVAIGFVLVVLVYMGGHISGGHYNPAVTLAVLLTKNIKLVPSVVYIFTQIVAGYIAAITYTYISNAKFVPTVSSSATIPQAFLLEILFSFLLCTVVLNAAVSEKTKGNSYFGLAIGLTVMVGAFVAGPISGGVFNPAVALGPILFDSTNISMHMNNLSIYLTAPLLGAAIASLLFKMR